MDVPQLKKFMGDYNRSRGALRAETGGKFSAVDIDNSKVELTWCAADYLSRSVAMVSML